MDAEGTRSGCVDVWRSVVARDRQQVEMLLTEGDVPVDERNDVGESALHLAASRGDEDMVALLLAHGADLRLRDWESGWTALHRSVYREHLATTLMLLRHARLLYGRPFMKEYLYETRDFGHQSAMDLVSSKTESAGQEEPPRGGMVFTFGKVDFQLGYHLPHVNVQASPRLVELPAVAPIVQISASKFHTVALNECGQVFVWGFGKGGRLGTGTEFDHVEPAQVRALEEISIVSVAAGENHTLALSRSGQVFSWGSNSFGQLGHNLKACSHESRLTPKRIDTFRGMHMSAIAASGCHSSAIDGEDGSVYTWGSNKKGQLGRKEGFGGDQPNPSPKRVDRLVQGHALSVIYERYESVRVEQVSMSDVHTCVILRCTSNGQSRGQVWQFGYGSNVPSRMNFKDKRRTRSQLLTESWIPRWKLQSRDIVSISCAPNHSIALSSCGAVYTWGHNGDALSHQDQLPAASSSSSSTTQKVKNPRDFIPPGAPQRVTALDKYGAVTSVCASQDHCVIVTRKGDVVSWGGGAQGVLGHGPSNSWQPKPKQIPGAKKVVAVAAGHQHTVLLVAPCAPHPKHLASKEAGSNDTASLSMTTPPKLRSLLEDYISGLLDITNAPTVWKYANVYSHRALEQYCVAYMRRNWDAILEIGGKERLDVLFDLMLPPCSQPIRRPAVLVEVDKPATTSKAIVGPSKAKKASRSLSFGEPLGTSVAKAVVSPVMASRTLPLAGRSPAIKPQQAPGQGKKPSKFVTLDAFLAEKKPRSDEAVGHSLSSPWKPTTASLGAPPMSPLLRPSTGESLSLRLGTPPQRKSSIGSYGNHTVMDSPRLPKPLTSPALQPRKQVLCQDGSERAQISSFSLDAFIKKSVRKKSRSDSMGTSQEASSSWGVVPTTSKAMSTPVVAKKSLMQIQAEEEERAAAEAAAKALNGGFVRKSSTVNSWGLVGQQEHISLMELQKREEEERFLEEQRAIMAQIERENRSKLQNQQNQQQNQNQGKPRNNTASSTSRGKKTRQPSKSNGTDAHASTDAFSNQRTAPTKAKGKQSVKPNTRPAGINEATDKTENHPSNSHGNKERGKQDGRPAKSRGSRREANRRAIADAESKRAANLRDSEATNKEGVTVPTSGESKSKTKSKTKKKKSNQETESSHKPTSAAHGSTSLSASAPAFRIPTSAA